MLGGSAATLVAGETPAVGFDQVMLAALMVLLWGSATVAGVAALCRQCRHGIGLAVWVTDHRVAASSRVVSAAARVGCPGIPGLVAAAGDQCQEGEGAAMGRSPSAAG